eukprot:CAMPEP_0113600310 /NCGR_PEP_ID=MMETSP0015_2-20120614/42638_1 /TAXON_ID=2838 /ORGANISM="Odontella" /LENGTH=306 /DNA_ID=CAMNT_0000508557 /DNA_START=313 /DNA_END=1233 /DNA_ORIENTATION=+ /assembly_acc=CAM_ASM_000160
MPRGKSYVNNNRGVSLQASNKKKASQMVACMYGAGCTRDDCIYRHPHGKSAKGAGQGAAEYQSREPCMPFLAGICTFPATGCRKRHPPQAEAERLIAKYRSTNCRFGDECRTRGCLYLHPAELDDDAGGCSPALGGRYAASPTGMGTMGMEEPAYIQPLPPPQAALHAGPQAVSPAPTSAWKPSLPGISGQYCTPATPQRGRSRSRSGSGGSGGSLSATAGAFVPRSATVSAATTPGRATGDLSASAGSFVPGSGFVPTTTTTTSVQTSATAIVDEPSPTGAAPSQGLGVLSPGSDPWAQQQNGWG